MPVPLAPPSTWAHDDPSRWESLVRAPSTPHAVALRCQCILRAAGSDGPSPLHVAHAWPGHRPPVRRWRPRSLAPGLHGLQEAPRSGRPRRFAPLSAAGGEGEGHAAPCAVPLRCHPRAPRCSGGGAGAAAPLGQESRPQLAPAGRGSPPPPASGLWAPPPRSGRRAARARPLGLIAPGPALLGARACGPLHRCQDGQAAAAPAVPAAAPGPWHTGAPRACLPPAWGAGLHRLGGRRHGARRLASGPAAHHCRGGRPAGPWCPPPPREAALGLGGGEPPAPLEPGGLPPGRPVGRGAVRGHGATARGTAARGPERSPPYAWLPLSSHTRRMAQPRGMVGERLRPSVAHTRCWPCGPRCDHTLGGRAGGRQPPARPSIAVARDGATPGAGHPMQPHASSTPSWTGLVERTAHTM
jgi:hypothetical protein